MPPGDVSTGNSQLIFFCGKLTKLSLIYQQIPTFIRLLGMLTCISLASFLWDIGKQNSPRCDASFCCSIPGAILYAKAKIKKCLVSGNLIDPFFWPPTQNFLRRIAISYHFPIAVFFIKRQRHTPTAYTDITSINFL